MDPEKQTQEMKEKAQKFAAPDGVTLPIAPKEKTIVQNPPAGEPPKWTPNPLWDELKGQDGFVMPEVTKENEQTLIKEQLVKFGLAEPAKPAEPKQPDIVDPEYKSYLDWKASNPQKTMEDFVTAKTATDKLLKMDGADFMKEALILDYGKYDEKNNPLGITDEQIDEYVSALEDNKTLHLEVLKRKREFAAKQQTTSPKQDDNKMQESIQQNVDKVLLNHADEADLNGIKLSKAEVGEVNDAFKKAVMPDDAGKVRIVEMLNDDEALWNFFAFNYLGEKKIKEKVFNAKDATKDEIYKRLGLTPKISSKQAAPANKNVLTPSKWAAPESE